MYIVHQLQRFRQQNKLSFVYSNLCIKSIPTSSFQSVTLVSQINSDQYLYILHAKEGRGPKLLFPEFTKVVKFCVFSDKNERMLENRTFKVSVRYNQVKVSNSFVLLYSLIL